MITSPRCTPPGKNATLSVADPLKLCIFKEVVNINYDCGNKSQSMQSIISSKLKFKYTVMNSDDSNSMMTI